MKKIILFSLLIIGTVTAKAQRVYFIYLQTEGSQPFFLRMNDKLYSSSASGYLILSKIKDSSYNFKIGFPGKDVDLGFSVTVNKKDHGYLIKDFGEKGWGLFDLQTLGIQMSTGGKGMAQLNNNGQVDAFTDLLSKAANDPSIRQTPQFARAEEKKADVVQPAVVKEILTTNPPNPTIEKETRPDTSQQSVAKKEEKDPAKEIIKDTTAAVVKTEVKTEEKKPEEKKLEENKPVVADAVVQQPAFKKSQVVKISGTRTSNGIELNFVDQYPDGKKDTVNIIIPAQEAEVVKVEPKQEEKKFLDITADPKAGENVKDSVKDKPVVIVPKNGCRAIAVEDDFLKLRRKMSAKTNDDGRLDEAKKYFKLKCFSTAQIRDLGSMFLSDAGKYHLYDAAYEHTSDAENFSSLASSLKDEYYIGRFKAMLHN